MTRKCERCKFYYSPPWETWNECNKLSLSFFDTDICENCEEFVDKKEAEDD